MRFINRIKEGSRFVDSITDYIKDEGYAVFLFRLFKVIISPLFRYDRVVIVVRDLNESIRDCRARKKVEYSYLSYKDRERLYDIMYEDKRTIGRKLNNGHLCCIAEIDGEVAGYNWISFIDEYVPEIDKVFKVKEGEEVYLYNHRTFNRFRGKYLFPALLVNIIKYLRDNDYNRVYALSYVKNNPSIKALKVAGFQESYVITFIKILWFKRYYYSDPIQR